MLLKSVLKSSVAVPIRWSVDCPASGVVILDVTVGDGVSAVPVHWRAGDWTKPPLDLRLSRAGVVEQIQFVFQDESVDAGDLLLPAGPEAGLPIFDLDGWPEDRYLDARVAVKTQRLPSGELYAAIGDSRPERVVSVTRGLRFGFDSSDQLAAIALGPLSSSEWQVIEASAPDNWN